MFAKSSASGDAGSSSQATEVSHPDQIAAGRLELKFHTAYMVLDTTPVAPVGRVDAVKQAKLPDGKKWFMAPSLQTGSGKPTIKPWSWSEYRAEVSCQPGSLPACLTACVQVYGIYMGCGVQHVCAGTLLMTCLAMPCTAAMSSARCLQ
jgi:hypothetical protein